MELIKSRLLTPAEEESGHHTIHNSYLHRQQIMPGPRSHGGIEEGNGGKVGGEGEKEEVGRGSGERRWGGVKTEGRREGETEGGREEGIVV